LRSNDKNVISRFYRADYDRVYIESCVSLAQPDEDSNGEQKAIIPTRPAAGEGQRRSEGNLEFWIAGHHQKEPETRGAEAELENAYLARPAGVQEWLMAPFVCTFR
jgi:hypothetical protein